jgi:Mrp family chromosome partitioning ATPase/capsular polysaccharide biosynthesis protein
MQPVDMLAALKRRWPIVAVCFVLALVVSLPAAKSQPAAPTAQTFVSKSTVLVAPDGSIPPALVVALTVSDVPSRVADDLDLPGGAADVTKAVLVESDSETGVIKLTATAKDAKSATDLADSFARNILVAVEDEQVASREETADTLRKDLDDVRSELSKVQGQLAASPDDPVLKAQRDGLQDRQKSIITRLRNSQAVLPGEDVTVLRQASVAVPDGETASSAPVTPLRKIFLFAMLGLAMGVLAALGVERFDPRPHRREDLEAAFRMRTLAVIPYQRPGGRSRRPTTVPPRTTEPRALAAFRTLRTALLVTRPYSLLNPDEPRAPEPTTAPLRRRVVLVATVRESLDSTVVSAGLASALAESGTRVLAIDGDHLRGRLTAMLGLGSGPGLVDLLERTSLRPEELAETVQVSAGTPHVAAIPCGVSTDYPGASPERVRGVLDPARDFADVVVVDGAPILDAVQSLDLLPVVDGVLLVATPGDVLRDEAEQVAEILDNLGAKVFGLVLIEPTHRKVRRPAGRAERTDAPARAAVTGGPRSHRAREQQSAEPAASHR